MNASLPILSAAPPLDPVAPSPGVPSAKPAVAGSAKPKNFTTVLAAADKQSERKPAAASPADLAALGMPLPVAGNPPPPLQPPVQPSVQPLAKATALAVPQPQPQSPPQPMAGVPSIDATAVAPLEVPAGAGGVAGKDGPMRAALNAAANALLAGDSAPKPAVEPRSEGPAAQTAALAHAAPPALMTSTASTAVASVGRGVDGGGTAATAPTNQPAAPSAVVASVSASTVPTPASWLVARQTAVDSAKAKTAVMDIGTGATAAASAAAGAGANAALNAAPPAAERALAVLVSAARTPVNPDGAVASQNKSAHAGDAAALAAGSAAGAASAAAAFAAGPAPVASASGGILPGASLATNIHSPEFPQALADRVTWIVDQNLNGASLQVNPPHLGPIELRVSIERGHADILMSAHNAATVAALQSSAPKLRELLGAQGFGQVNVDVSQRSFQDRQSYPRSTSSSSPAATVNAVAAVGTPVTVARARGPQGALDAYA